MTKDKSRLMSLGKKSGTNPFSRESDNSFIVFSRIALNPTIDAVRRL